MIRNRRLEPSGATVSASVEAAPKATIKHSDPYPVAVIRCAITGKPITAAEVKARHQIVKLIHEENKLPEDGDPAAYRRRYVPLAIDTSHPFPTDGGGAYRDYLGGLEWSVPLSKWFGSETTTLLADALRDYHEWWCDLQIVDALRLEFGNERVDAILEYVKDRASETDIDRAFNHSIGWTRRQYSRCAEYVRDNYRPKLRDIGRDGLREFATKRTVRWPDGTAPGQRAAERATQRLREREARIAAQVPA